MSLPDLQWHGRCRVAILGGHRGGRHRRGRNCRRGLSRRCLGLLWQVAENIVEHVIALFLYRQEEGLHKAAAALALWSIISSLSLMHEQIQEICFPACKSAKARRSFVVCNPYMRR